MRWGWGRVRVHAEPTRLVDAGLVLLALATLALVAAVVFNERSASSTLSVTEEDGWTSATPSAAESMEQLAEPVPTAAPVAAPTPSATRAPVASPSPPAPPLGLRVFLRAGSIGGRAARVTIRVVDNDGTGTGGSVSFGDGSTERLPASGECPAGPAPYDATHTVTHTYRRAGTYTVTVTVRTGRPCSGGRAETATRRVQVVISGARPGPAAASPTPRSTPSPTRAPAPRPSPSPSRTPAAASSPPTSEPTPSEEPSAAPTAEPTTRRP